MHINLNAMGTRMKRRRKDVAAQNFCQNFSKLLAKLFGKYFRYL